MEDLRTPRRLNFHPLESDIVTFPPSLLILAEILTLLAHGCIDTTIGLSKKTAVRRSGGKMLHKSSALATHITRLVYAYAKKKDNALSDRLHGAAVSGSPFPGFRSKTSPMPADRGYRLPYP
jgi:hypothetical protein